MTTRSLRARRLATAMAMILGAALLVGCGGSSPAAPTAAHGNQAAMATILQIEPAGVHIAGLGGDAFWIPTSGILFARKGDHGVELLDPDLGTDASHAATRDALVALAQAALPNI